MAQPRPRCDRVPRSRLHHDHFRRQCRERVKPASQLAVIDALLRTGTSEQGKLKIWDAVARAVRIPTWSMEAEVWRGIIVKQNGAIDAGREAKRRMADLLVYLIAADRLSPALMFGIWKRFNAARGHDIERWLETDG